MRRDKEREMEGRRERGGRMRRDKDNKKRFKNDGDAGKYNYNKKKCVREKAYTIEKGQTER